MYQMALCLTTLGIVSIVVLNSRGSAMPDGTAETDLPSFTISNHVFDLLVIGGRAVPSSWITQISREQAGVYACHS